METTGRMLACMSIIYTIDSIVKLTAGLFQILF